MPNLTSSLDPIVLRREFFVELWYNTLAHLKLDANAANLYDNNTPAVSWSAQLRDAYLAAPGRLYAQITPLLVEGEQQLYAWLENRCVPGLSDPLDHRFGTLMQKAMAETRPQLESTWQQHVGHVQHVEGELVPELQHLRKCLWQDLRQPPPPLVVHDCDALLGANGTAGRATQRGQLHIIAVSCASTYEDALCQLLHEEIHVISDPVVRAQYRNCEQDTVAGNALHTALENRVVELGWRLVIMHAPKLQAAYATWAARFGYDVHVFDCV